jgi:glycosyltransferase involved in cell wall biosynthesis
MPERPLNLLIVLIDLAGGVGVFVRNLARGLHRYFPGEFSISLLLMRSGTVADTDRPLFNEIRELDSPVHEDYRRFLETIPNALRLRRALKSLPADVTLTFHNHPSLLVPLVAPRRRTILSVHGHLSTLLRRSITRPVLRALIRSRFRKHLIVVPAQGIADDLAQNFGIANTNIIPHGIDLDRIATLAAEPVTDLPPTPYIVTLGRLVREKDHATLLRAFALAKSQNLPHRLVIIGSGDLEHELKSLAQSLNISTHVTFLGHRDNPYPILKHADFFVLSSITEGFGLALVEAMSLGLPCISTNCPSGPAEILDDGTFGLLVEPRDPAALSKVILKIASDPELKQNLANLAIRRAQDFSLEQMARQYRDLFLKQKG